MSLKQNNRKILSGCFVISLILHAFAIGFLQRYSLWFSSVQKGTETAGYLSLVDKQERDQILKTTFEPLAKEKGEEKRQRLPEKENVASLGMHASVVSQDPEFSNPIQFQSSFSLPMHEFLAAHPALPTFSFPSASFNLLDHLPKDLIIPVPSKQTLTKFLPLPTHSAITMSAPPPPLEQEVPPAPISYSKPIDLPLTDVPQIAKAPSMIPIPNLPKLPSLADLDTSSYSDSFDADLIFSPKEDGSGYIFALTLIPRPDLELPRIRQHFTFLIDRSNSIQQGRLAATKSAIHKALEELSPDDTFNIIAFDSKMEKMSPNSLPCIGKSFAFAEEFLDKIQLGSFFSTTDLYRPLFLTVPGQVQNDEIYTAILLTDGEALAKKNVQRSVLSDWTRYNAGKVALYAVGLNSDSRIATLDVATAYNKGKLTNAPTNRGIKRKLMKLLKMIRNPIGKNIACHAISKSPQTKVYLYPKQTQMPNLYLDQPYVILGETDSLDDFILFVQGRLQDRWLNIKKTISFLNAKKGNKSLKAEWALQCAYNLYENYLIDENPKYIAEAETLLAPFEYQTAFR